MNFDYFQLEALGTVVSEGSFQRAADHLLVTQSAISQRIRALEDSVGQPLLIRSSPPALTELGQKYISVFAQMKILMADLQNRSEENCVKISVASNTECFDIWFNKCLVDFTKDSGVLFDVHLADQDHTLDLLRSAKVLACISSEKRPVQGCYSYPLKEQSYICVAHKDFVRKHNLNQRSKEKLLELPTTIYGSLDMIHDKFLKEIFNTKKVPPYKAHIVPSVSGMLEYIQQKAVYAIMPRELVEDKLNTGTYVNIFPKYQMRTSLYWHVVQTEIPSLKQLTSEVLER